MDVCDATKTTRKKVDREETRMEMELVKVNYRGIEHKIRLLHEAAQEIISINSTGEILTRVVETAVSICESESGFILLQDDLSKNIYIRAEKGFFYEKPTLMQVRGNDSLINHVIYSGKPVRVTAPDIKIAIVFLAKSLLCVPMISPRQKKGALCVVNWYTSNEFSLDDEYLLFTLANYASRSLENVQFVNELKKKVTFDWLTGVMNRRAFEEILNSSIEYCKRYGTHLTILFIDIDGLKTYNDTYGHVAGDERIKAVAELLKKQKRITDHVARYGGDEFAIIATNTDLKSTKELAERIQKTAELSTPFSITTHCPQPGFTLSMGMASYPVNGKEAIDLLKAADKALYKAKRAGKNQIMCPD
jgi:diguanylate cyclase (GGDEF)-like protein